MTPSRPYLIRSLYEWIVDNHLTPFLTIDATQKGVIVPQKYVRNGVIVLDVSSISTKNPRFGNDAIEFDARFGSALLHVYLPIPAVTAIFAKETNQGMMFSAADIENYEETVDKEIKPTAPTKKKKPKLKLIKGSAED